MIEYLEHRMYCSSFRVLRAIDQSPDARVGDCAGTHRAGLDRYVEIAIEQTIVAHGFSGFAQCKYFGMRRWIAVEERPVAPRPIMLPIMHNDGADRDFAHHQRALRLAQRFLHPKLVGDGHGKV